MQLAINKAKRHGVGMVCVRNSTHYGFAGYYGLMAADAGCIGVTGTNARPSIAPTYGVEPMMGTNPLVFGIPSDDAFPFVLDCATSVNQRGKIEKYAREGQPTPRGAVISTAGDELTDSNDILDALVARTAALTPLGGAGHAMAGYKGYGYAATVEILCAALQGNQWGEALSEEHVDKATGEKKTRPSKLGHFFIAIDAEAFGAASRSSARPSPRSSAACARRRRTCAAAAASTRRASPSTWRWRTARRTAARPSRRAAEAGSREAARVMRCPAGAPMKYRARAVREGARAGRGVLC